MALNPSHAIIFSLRKTSVKATKLERRHDRSSESRQPLRRRWRGQMANVFAGRRQTCVRNSSNSSSQRYRDSTFTKRSDAYGWKLRRSPWASFLLGFLRRRLGGATESRSETESPSTDVDCPAGQPSASAKRPAAKKRTKVFQISWLSDPEFKSWLAYDETNGVMTCRFCLASNFDNNFTRGCRDLQRSALVRHINPIIRKDHSRAVADAEQRKANAIAVQNALTFQEAAVYKALKPVYWLAKEEVASMKFPSYGFVHLLTMFGDPDVHRLRAEDPMPLDEGCPWLTSPATFYFQLAILLCKVWHEKVCLR